MNSIGIHVLRLLEERDKSFKELQYEISNTLYPIDQKTLYKAIGPLLKTKKVTLVSGRFTIPTKM